MSEAEETPAQKQARIRRERREAKIKAGGTDRLDKITRLSGRTPEHMRHESPSSTPAASSPAASSPAIQPTNAPTPPLQPFLSDAADPAQIQAQEEFIRSMLRAPSPNAAGPQQGPEDPMVKMLQTMLAGGMGGGAGGGPDPLGGGGADGAEMPSFSADDLSNITGLPSFVTNMLFGKPPQTAEQKRQEVMWKIIHAVFAIIMGIYTAWTVRTSISVFGPKPPSPAMVQNPFMLFVTGELLVEGARLTLKGMGSPKGIGAWYQLAKDVSCDGGIVIFLLGMTMWWYK